MNNSYFEDCGVLLDESSLREELNDIQASYFSSATDKQTVESTVDAESDLSFDECDDEDESEGQLNNTATDDVESRVS